MIATAGIVAANRRRTSAPPLVCSLLISQTSAATGQCGISSVTQNIKGSGTLQVCKIRLKVDTCFGAIAGKITVNGVDSDTRSWSGTAWIDFTFSSPVSVSGDWSFTYTATSNGGNSWVYWSNSDPYLPGEGYDVAGVPGRDLGFEVWTMQ